MLGDALDRQDRVRGGVRLLAGRNAISGRSCARLLEPEPGRPSHRSFIETIAAQVERAPPMAKPGPLPAVPGEAAGHVFLLGYPRSGTTLVENILASAAEVVALEEHDTLADTDGILVANDGTMPDLDALDPALVADLRAALLGPGPAAWRGTSTGGSSST